MCWPCDRENVRVRLELVKPQKARGRLVRRMASVDVRLELVLPVSLTLYFPSSSLPVLAFAYFVEA